MFCTGVPAELLPGTGQAVGVDVGVTVAAALSDGRVIDNPRHLRRSADALAAGQRVVSRRRRGSRRRAKAGEGVAALHRRIANQRRDFLHKQSRALVNDHDVIGWGSFRSMLAYKAEEAGRQLVVVNPRHSSQTCAHCGHIDKDNRLGTVFQCVSCGHHDHADVNAAVNILRAGLAQRLAREAKRAVA